jgi:hypothetical protein
VNIDFDPVIVLALVLVGRAALSPEVPDHTNVVVGTVASSRGSSSRVE